MSSICLPAWQRDDLVLCMLVQTSVWCDRLMLHRCAAWTSVITKRGPLLAWTTSGELFIHFLQLVLLRHNNEKTFLIWINEEDHTRIISMEKGGNMKRVFERFCRGLKQVQMRQTWLYILSERCINDVFNFVYRWSSWSRKEGGNLCGTSILATSSHVPLTWALASGLEFTYVCRNSARYNTHTHTHTDECQNYSLILSTERGLTNNPTAGPSIQQNPG